MVYECTAYLFPDGNVMIHGNKTTDNLDNWLNPEEKKKAKKVILTIDESGEQILGKVVNQ